MTVDCKNESVICFVRVVLFCFGRAVGLEQRVYVSKESTDPTTAAVIGRIGSKLQICSVDPFWK